MKLYLSSYKLGQDPHRLQKLLPRNGRIAYIPNALDYSKDLERREKSEEGDIAALRVLDFEVETVDLRQYFGHARKLRSALRDFEGTWVRGGNTFVLRQAMHLSGFDEAVQTLAKRDDFVYGGYSAGACVLAPSLKGLEVADDPKQKPYPGQRVIWEGLGVLPYAIVPHFRSDHPESNAMEKLVEHYLAQKVPFVALKDGEVLVLEYKGI